jgi:hypothetical protein
MKMSGRYAPGLYAGVTGFLLLVSINAFSIPDSLQQAKERDRLSAEADLEKIKAETAKKVAEAYSENAIATFEQLTVNDYVLSNTPPRIDWQYTVDPTKKTFVYDRYRKCVGYAYKGKFFFIKYYSEEVCNNGTR